ncbi:C40 family peptidase [Ferrovum sp.]|uniref:C40 family peptidase n=1 Tax=Ferrovum sp. TaxID=2609467 RepID=UPI0026360F53|nr:C40 family peptidase [Ferrovum sp.]
MPKPVDDMFSAVEREAIKNYPNESCGLVLETAGGKSLTVACENISDRPRENFVLNPLDYAKAMDLGKVVGVWHTHVELPSRASDPDKTGCERSGLPWYIFSIRKQGDEFKFEGPTSISPSGFEIDYIGRPYVVGILDCYALVQDYYKREYGIELGSYPVIDEKGIRSHTLFDSKYKEQGFANIDIESDDKQKGDIFLMQISDRQSNHIGIYLGDGIFMHHQHGRLSRKDVYGGMWQKHTTRWLRHKTFIKA